MQKLKKVIAASLFLALIPVAITACKVEIETEGETSMPEARSLQGTAWWVEDIAGKGVIDMSHTTIDLTEEQKVAGDSGCNRYFGNVGIGDGDISFGVLGGTRKACPEALMNQEMSFFEAMGKVVSWEIADTGLLHLRDADGNDQIRAAATDEP